MNTQDRFCLNGFFAMLVAMLSVAALTYSPKPGYGEPVKLYRAKPVASKIDRCRDDFVCILHAESLAKARPSKGKGYSERERNDLNKLIARLP